MAQSRDKNGRPVVVVTGMGIVTSLGAGKADNWKNLTAGNSGIRAITRFPTDGLKTRVAGTVDFVPLDPPSAPALCRTARRDRRSKKRSRNRRSAARRLSPARCSSPSRRSKSNGRSAKRSPRPPAPMARSPTTI